MKQRRPAFPAAGKSLGFFNFDIETLITDYIFPQNNFFLQEEGIKSVYIDIDEKIEEISL